MSLDVTIVGGGHQGLAMAAHLSMCGLKIGLWNRTRDNIRDIIVSNKIYCSGIYNGQALIAKASDNIDSVLSNVIMVTTPSSAHKDIARLLAPRINDTFTVILNPGRTFGALEFKKILIENGCEVLPNIVETQTIVYTCRRMEENNVRIYAMKKNVKITSLNSDKETTFNILPAPIKPYFIYVDNYFDVTLSNMGMILHCAPVLLNIGWIENSRVDFKYYYEGITPTIADLIQRMDDERIAVGKAAGVNLETITDWLKRTYELTGNDLYECLRNNIFYKDIDAPKTLQHRYIEEDVPNGLCAIESMGKAYGVDVSIISMVIDLADNIMKKKYRLIGRNYNILFTK